MPVQKIITGNILVLAENEEEAQEIAKELRISSSDVIDRNQFLEEAWEVAPFGSEATEDYEAEECLNYEE